MKIETSQWKEFILGGENGIFKIENCKCSNAENLLEGTDIYYIGAKKNDNGIMKKVAYDSQLITKGNCIVFICDGQGSVGYANYMDRDFIGSTTLSVGYNKNLNQYTGMFLVAVLNLERPKYSFGRKYRRHLSNTIIKLPATSTGSPDWGYMELYIKSLNHKKILTKITTPQHKIDFNNWKEYYIGDLFRFIKGKRLTKNDMVDGEINYLGAISENNGVRQCIQVDPKFISSPNCITVNYNGSVGEAFYQHKPFWASDDVNILYSKGWDMNKYNALFIITVIKANRYRFSYSRKWTLEKMKETIIKLPAKQDGTPDFEYMENYIKSLPYSDKI